MVLSDTLNSKPVMESQRVQIADTDIEDRTRQAEKLKPHHIDQYGALQRGFGRLEPI